MDAVRATVSALLAISILIAISCTRWRGIFKGFSQDGGQTNFSKNLRASLFKDDLSTFSQINLAGQCL
jgi:hypothetical protein